MSFIMGHDLQRIRLAIRRFGDPNLGEVYDILQGLEGSRPKGSRNKAGPQQSRDPEGNQIVAYDAEFVRRQRMIYFHTCVVCRKRNYCMTECSRCQLAKCCNDECLRKHSLDEQQVICVRNVTFNEARKLIPSQVKNTIFKLGFSEISPHLYSIPRYEVYEQMGGTRSVILLQVISAQIVNTVVTLFAQDVDGINTVLNVYPPAESSIADVLWCEQVRKSIPHFTFILLRNSCLNLHFHEQSAAVDIRDFNCITRLENSQEIDKLVTQKDFDALTRNLIAHLNRYFN